MSIAGLLGRKRESARAQGIVQGLIPLVVELMADDAFTTDAPTITTYLRDKKTHDLLNAIDGCASLLEQARGSFSPLNPDVIRHSREALMGEVRRRA